jgi:hypothetical protein
MIYGKPVVLLCSLSLFGAVVSDCCCRHVYVMPGARKLERACFYSLTQLRITLKYFCSKYSPVMKSSLSL